MSYDAQARRETALAAKLKAHIAHNGTLTVRAFMRACLDDPEHGYYRTRAAIGQAGDFITAPEISQIFGELIGLWCGVVWQQMGRPARIDLVELGPGRGTLMRDALRAARSVPGFLEAVSVRLVEPNAVLVPLQQQALEGHSVTRTWHVAIDALPPAECAIVIGNEFLDVLPIAQFVRRGAGWLERGVGVDGAGQLAMTDMPVVVQDRDGDLDAELGRWMAGAAEGAIRELADLSILPQLARWSSAALLFIDYGHERSDLGDSLQAVRAHTFESPLCSPGEADVTAHVDFERVARHLGERCGLVWDGPITQSELLAQLGALQRAARLMAANPAKAHEIEVGIARLMAPGGMGTRFKALGARSPHLPPLPALQRLDSPPARA